MAEMVLMPQKGVSDESAVLAQWLVKEGDAVKKDQNIFVQETGKSSFECECPADGVILKIFVQEGEEVAVGVPVCAVGNPGEKVDAPAAGEAPAAPAAQEAAAPAAAPAAAAAPAPTASAPSADGMIKASPRARMLAQETGMDLSAATPTGPDGRIIERDVKELMKNGAAPAPAAAAAQKTAAPAAEAAQAAAYEDKPLPKIRKVIAANMHKSLSEMAQLTLNRTFDATAIMEYRKLAKASKGMGVENLTINDFILFAVARTLPEFPDLNAHFLGDKMRYFNGVQLGVAVDTPRGLMVPVLRNAEKMSLLEISTAVKEKAAACKAGNISPDELSGGSFTVSNLGSTGVESFTPVINPPQTAILGVDTFTLRPKEVNGEIKFYKAMGLSLTFDHRALDGSPAAQFLKVLSERLENFSLLLAL